MICPRCGSEIEDNGFCPFCGFELSKENIQNLSEIEKFESQENIEVRENISPFNPSGRLGRLPYIVTKLSLFIIFNVAVIFKSSYFYVYLILSFFLYIASVFAASKRLRDIKWAQWYLLIWILPIIGIVIGAPLLVLKSKYSKDFKNNELS